MNIQNNPKIAFYLRSADDNEENIISQKRILQIFVSLREDLLDRSVVIYSDIPQSGSKPGPNFLKMCHDVKAGKIDVVMVSELNRVSRSWREVQDFAKFVKTQKFRFIAVQNSMDSNDWIYMEEKPGFESVAS